MSKQIVQRQCDFLTACGLPRLLLLAAVMTLPACNGESGRTGSKPSEGRVANFISYLLNTLLAPALRTTSLLPGNSVDLLNSGETPAAPAAIEKTAASPPAAVTVLYIEDNPDDLRAMRQMFASLHTLTLRVTRTGEYGINLATANPPALILLDMALPGINGAEVLRRLREHPATRDIPVVAITPHSGALGIELGGTAFDDYLAKPVDTASLESVLNRRLGNNQKQPSEPATLVQQ